MISGITKTTSKTMGEAYPYRSDPREFAGELTIHDFCTCHPNTNKKYAYTNKELEIRRNFYKNSASVNLYEP